MCKYYVVQFENNSLIVRAKCCRDAIYEALKLTDYKDAVISVQVK